jgi:hypothetical protein
MLLNVRKTTHDEDKKIVSDFEILQLFTAAKDIIKGVRGDWYFWRKEDLGTITTVADTRKYSLSVVSARMEYIKDIRFLFNNGSVEELYPIDYRTDLEFDRLVINQTETGDDRVRLYNIMPADASSDAGYIRVHPKPVTTGYGSFYIRWYINEADFVSPSDMTLIPLPKLLEYYAISIIERYKGNEKKAEEYRLLFYGPPPKARDKSALQGIPLLEQMHRNKLRPLGHPRQLLRWRGPKAVVNLFKSYSESSLDNIRETYW